MTNAALIVAAGRGSRMMRETPKQYLMLGSHSVLWRTLQTFLASDQIHLIRVVIHPDDQTLYENTVANIYDARLAEPVFGGAMRASSVRLGLEALREDPPRHVLIHDAARPFCAQSLIAAVLQALEDAEGAFAALPVTDALWKTSNLEASAPVPRDGLWRAQTPQAFRYAAILDAHTVNDAAPTANDDVETAHNAGMIVRVVEGDEDNFKITLPQDLERARYLNTKRFPSVI